jgi:uncharacterized repeat protein (TIGR03803 family)
MPNKKALIVFVVAAVVFGLLAMPSPASAASSEQVLYSFCSLSGCGDGEQPTAGMIFDKLGNLYGTTTKGGFYGHGTVFELIPNNGTWTEKLLHSFNANGKDGYFPSSALIFDAAGNLYGTTVHGGSSSNCYDGCGTVFELTPGTGGKWTEKILHEFNGTDGDLPDSSLILDAAGNLYGTTFGGGAPGYGLVFQLTLSNGKWTQKVLHEFNGKGGSVPDAGLVLDAAGNLYGTTSAGGAGNYGLVFQLAPSNGKWTENVLHEFNGTSGSVPRAGVVLDGSGNLYGTTDFGGTQISGTVFQLIPNNGKWTAKVLHNFGSASDGSFPSADLVRDQSANLYGTTASGGTYVSGTLFELIPNNGQWTENVLHSFGSGNDGSFPSSRVILDSAGNLYGTTDSGGAHGGGAVFEVTP